MTEMPHLSESIQFLDYLILTETINRLIPTSRRAYRGVHKFAFRDVRRKIEGKYKDWTLHLETL